MDPTSSLQTAMALIRQAVQADSNLDFLQAIDLYSDGIAALQNVLDRSCAQRLTQLSIDASNPKLRATLESRIQEYNERVEYLLQQLDKTLNPPSDIPDAPTFDASSVLSNSASQAEQQRKEYEDHHPHRVAEIAAPNLPEFDVAKPSLAATNSAIPPEQLSIHGDTTADQWVYVPEVIPERPNFASIGFSQFHNNFAPAGSVPGNMSSVGDDDDVFRLSQRTFGSNVQPGALPSQSSSSFQQTTKQVIDGKVFTYGPSAGSPYGTSSAAMAEMKNDLQLALDTAERAKEEDKKKEFQKAFLLYRRALDYFVKVLNADLNQYTRTSLNKTVKVYVSRAEKLKEYLEKTNQLPTDDTDILEPAVHPHVPFNPASSSAFATPPTESVPEKRPDLDIRVGPTVKEAQTTFWNDSSPLFMRVDITKNLATPGDTFNINVLVQNRSSIKVSELKVAIIQTETLTTIDVKAQRKVEVKPRTYNPRSYNPDQAFPLKSTTWQGFLEYWVPGDILFTDADFSTSFSREHKLVITCEIPRHNNLSIEFPIRIVPYLAADGSANPNNIDRRVK